MANWHTLVAASLGTIIGPMIEAVPDLSATMKMALLSPHAFLVEPAIDIPLLIGSYKG